MHISSYLAQILGWEIFQGKVVGRNKTHILFYEVMCGNILEAKSPQMTIWPMRISCWIPIATNTRIICNVYCFFTVTVVVQTRHNVALYKHCLSCVQRAVLVINRLSSPCIRINGTGTQLLLFYQQAWSVCTVLYSIPVRNKSFHQKFRTAVGFTQSHIVRV